MEPFAVQSQAPGLIRPALDLQSDLSAVLREGRVLSGEVLQTLDGGTLLIGVGRHRVPAEAEVRLQPGERFLFQVAREQGRTVLELLAPSARTGPSLLQALLAVAGGGAGQLGELLGELARELGGGAAGQPAGPPGGGLPGDTTEFARLFEDAGRLLALGDAAGEPRDPLAAARRLLAAVRSSGLGYEARLAEAALADLGAARAGALGRELASLLLAQLGWGLAGHEPEAFARALAEALETRSARGSLVERLRAALAAMDASPDRRAAWLANLARALPEGLGPALEELVLAALAGREAAAPGDREAGARGDLKGLLLELLASLPEGAGRDAAGRALAELEREQLLNLARARSGEPLHLALPLLLAGQWSTVHVLVGERRDEEGSGAPGGGAHRLTVAVDLAHTGPVRADLAVRLGAPAARAMAGAEEGADEPGLASAGSVAVRISVARPEVLEAMRACADGLVQRLALGGRRVSLAFALAPAEEVRAERERADIRFLREHHVMDRSG